MTRPIAAACLLALFAVAPVPAEAHHGWRWTTGQNIELTGFVVEARLGNPHGLVTVDVEGERWTVEVGQPWRNERAGLSDAEFRPGREIRVEGEPSADIADRRLKAERLWFDGTLHDLYPGRD